VDRETALISSPQVATCGSIWRPSSSYLRLNMARRVGRCTGLCDAAIFLQNAGLMNCFASNGVFDFAAAACRFTIHEVNALVELGADKAASDAED
jgi:hypothetical protein